MTTAERQQRNDQIVELKARGYSYARIARLTKTSKSVVNDVMREFRASNPTLRRSDPIDIIDTMLEGYAADLDQLAALADSTTNEAVKVGAINSKMSARDRILGLMQATGVLPRQLGKLKLEIEARFVADRLLGLLEQYELPIEAHEQIAAVLGQGGMDSDVIEGTAQEAA